MADNRISVSWDDLHSRKVEARLREQAAVARNRAYSELGPASTLPEVTNPRTEHQGEGWLAALWYNPLFCMALFGLLGGLLAWGAGALIQFKPVARVEAADLSAAVR